MSRLILIRHGETDMTGRFCGHSDPELNHAGEQQALRSSEEVALLGIERIYSSDLRRASQTAALVAQRIKASGEVQAIRNLREFNFGLWEGLTWQEVEARFPQDAELWVKNFPLHCAPKGEAYAEFSRRIDAAMEPLLREAEKRTIAIVSHRGVMSYMLTRFFSFSADDAWAKTAPYAAVIVVNDCRNCLREATR
jgi:broad specificity phosphatase PhoE